MRSWRPTLALTFALVLMLAPAAHAQFTVSFGSSWDGVPLQDILDAEFGPGAVDMMTDYEGYLAGDADPSYWEDLGAQSIIIREIAGYADNNILGWYEETLTGAPAIDGIGDGVVFEGPMVEGTEITIDFSDVTRFGFYLNPNGTGDGINAPEPELFWTNRSYNDLGPDGSGAVNPPFDGDAQFLVYNVSHLRGTPAYVVAVEDLDSGAELFPSYTAGGTDNDYNDLVFEVRADSPVDTGTSSFGAVKSLFDR
jgi:hypothetical protein